MAARMEEMKRRKEGSESFMVVVVGWMMRNA